MRGLGTKYITIVKVIELPKGALTPEEFSRAVDVGWLDLAAMRREFLEGLQKA